MSILRRDYLKWAEEKVLQKAILTAGVESLIVGMNTIDIDKVEAIISVYKDAKEYLELDIKRYREEAERLALTEGDDSE